MSKKPPSRYRIPDDKLRAWMERLADELCLTVNGKFDHLVRMDVTDDTLEKLQMLVNFALDHARRAQQAQEEASRLASENVTLAKEVDRYREMGNYQLLEMLGKGGMGEVWHARHRMLARPVAIKVIRQESLGFPGSDADRSLARFQREARQTALLKSPHTIGVFDFGVHDGNFYYVMELLDGLDVELLVSEYGPQPPERVAYLLKQVCHSLEEAHQAGLIHRDIKPGNLFVCRHGIDLDFVKVLDFGLVKNYRDRTEPALTEDGYITGTPSCLAPEQIQGEDDVDGRADLYALGHAAYLMLTGRECFTGDSPLAVLMQQLQKPPKPVSSFVKIPTALEEIVMDCLSKERGDRPSSAAALRYRIDATGLADKWTADLRQKWWKAHRPKPPFDPDVSLGTAPTQPRVKT